MWQFPYCFFLGLGTSGHCDGDCDFLVLVFIPRCPTWGPLHLFCRNFNLSWLGLVSRGPTWGNLHLSWRGSNGFVLVWLGLVSHNPPREAYLLCRGGFIFLCLFCCHLGHFIAFPEGVGWSTPLLDSSCAVAQSTSGAVWSATSHSGWVFGELHLLLFS